MSVRVQMEVTEGEKQMLLALRRAALTVTPYNGSAALQAAMTGGKPTVEVQPRCKAMGRGDLQCVKEGGHSQRHRYGPKGVNPSEHRPPARAWAKEDAIGIHSGSRTYLLKVGNPCKVVGQRGLFEVISIEQHPDGRCNVEVKNDRNGHSRVFPVDRIIYKRPQKVTA